MKALEKAFDVILTRLLDEDTGFSYGQPAAEALLLARRGADMQGGDWVLPLADTAFAPDGDWRGTVKIELDADEKAVDLIEVVLLTDPYDRDRLVTFAVEAAERLGLDLEADEDSPWSLGGDPNDDSTLTIGFGEGVVAFELL